MDLSVSYIYGEAWELTKKHGLKVLALLCISIIVSIGANLISLPNDAIATYTNAIESGNTRSLERMAQVSSSPNTAVSLIQYIVSFIISCMTYALLIGCVRGRCTSIVSAIQSIRAVTYLKFIVVECLYALMIIVGIIFLIVPGIYLGVRFAWAPYYIVEHQDATIGQSLRWSWDASKDHVLELIGLALIALVLIAVGCIVMGIFIALGGLGGTAGISICALIAIILILCISVFINFAQAKVYNEMPTIIANQ